MQPAHLANKLKQRGVNQSSMPEITFIAKLFIPPISHLVPTKSTH
jgi:hypothetical protein